MNIVVWGCGIKGRRIYDILPKGTIKAYIDSNPAFIGSKFQGIPIISFNDYLLSEKQEVILISAHKYDEIVDVLEANHIEKYLILNDEPIQMYGLDRRPINEVFKERYSEESRYFIKGLNLYSVLLLEYFINRGICAQIDMDCDCGFFADIIRLNYSEFCTKGDLSELINEGDVIVYCNRYEEPDDEILSKKVNIMHATDQVKVMYRQTYPGLVQFKNRHIDQSCFIVANGPSLTYEDLNKIHEMGICSFGVNNIYKSGEHTKWSPDYYVVGDPNGTENDWTEIACYKARDKFVVDGADLFWSRILPSNIHKIHCSQDYGTRGIDVSEDITYSVSKGMTVIHVCFQIAIYMGFKKIYLIGADTTDYNSTSKSHFTADYIDEKTQDIIANPFLDVERMIKGYISIREFSKKQDVEIFNATRGGALEVFERVDFDTLFEVE